jgi:hypothetical protein
VVPVAVGGLAGGGLGSYLRVDLGMADRKSFIIGLGFGGLLIGTRHVRVCAGAGAGKNR